MKILDSAKVDCRKCGVRYGFDIYHYRDGFRTTKCPLCKHEQMTYVVFKAIAVPVPVGSQRV